MNDATRKDYGSKVLDTAESLLGAIQDAGGMIRLSELRDMSMEDFMLQIASCNGIRFHAERKVADIPEELTGQKLYALLKEWGASFIINNHCREINAGTILDWIRSTEIIYPGTLKDEEFTIDDVAMFTDDIVKIHNEMVNEKEK